jgi:hypothetical protein
MRNYCTYFDSNYLVRGLVTYQTLKEHSSREISLWVLCLDDKVHGFLSQANLSGIKPICLSELEAVDQALASLKQTRSRAEYYFTCTPCLAKFVLDQNPEISDITYIDSDLCFFNDPELIYFEIGENSIAITPHRFSSCNKFREQWGIYNVAFNYFRRDKDGLLCLNWWRDRCLEWCYDRLEDGKFADQKYLDDWPNRFDGVKLLDHPGVNLALWNLHDVNLEIENKNIFANGLPLIFYHFHALKQVSNRLFMPSWEIYEVKPCWELRFKIYQDYINRYFNVSLKYSVQNRLDSGLRIHMSNMPSWITEMTPREYQKYILNGRLLLAADKPISKAGMHLLEHLYSIKSPSFQEWLYLLCEAIGGDSYREVF